MPSTVMIPLRFVSLDIVPEQCGDDVLLDKSSFTGLYFSMVSEEHKEPSVYKLICEGPEERVVGIHIIGMGSDEAMQGFGVAVKMGGASLT